MSGDGRSEIAHFYDWPTEAIMIVTITTFNLPEPTTVAEITKTFEATAPKYMGLAGLVSKNYFLTEDGARAGGIYIWESRADADLTDVLDQRDRDYCIAVI